MVGIAALMPDRQDRDSTDRGQIEHAEWEPAGEAPTDIVLDKGSGLGIHQDLREDPTDLVEEFVTEIGRAFLVLTKGRADLLDRCGVDLEIHFRLRPSWPL